MMNEPAGNPVSMIPVTVGVLDETHDSDYHGSWGIEDFRPLYPHHIITMSVSVTGTDMMYDDGTRFQSLLMNACRTSIQTPALPF